MSAAMLKIIYFMDNQTEKMIIGKMLNIGSIPYVL